MPSGEWSAASARVKPATAALVVSYCRLPPPATTERTEATLTMAPPLLRRISGTAALAQKTYPIRLTSRISFQLAALASSTFSYLRMPALLMRMSRRPNFCAAPLTKSRHAASVPTSACVKATLAPPLASSAATRWPRSPSRSQNATLAPSATKRLTVASPIPDAPPVTAATLPSSRPMFATFHCIAKRASTIRRIHPAGTSRTRMTWLVPSRFHPAPMALPKRTGPENAPGRISKVSAGRSPSSSSKFQHVSGASRLLVGNRLLHDVLLSNEAGNAHVDEHRPHTGHSCWQSAATTNIVRTADSPGGRRDDRCLRVGSSGGDCNRACDRETGRSRR